MDFSARLANRWQPWFRAVDALGEDTRIRWGKLSLEGELLASGSAPHEHYDGVGLFAKLLREHEGYAGGLPELKQRAPEPRRRFDVVSRVLRAPDRPPLPWKHVVLRPSADPSPAFAWTLLSEEETRRFLSSGRARLFPSASVLHALQEAVVPELVHRAKAYVWLVPVNMRGAVPSPREESHNQISFLPVGMGHGANEGDVGKAMRDALKADLHWGTWDAMGVRAALGETFLRGFTRFLYSGVKRQGGTGWLGSFSFGGVLAPPAGTTAKYAWFGVPPTSLMWPISAGAFAWGGRMTFALQVHPSLRKDRSWAEAAVAAWKERALAGSKKG